MTPGARIAAAIEILERWEAEPGPAERAVSGYFRGRRYAGAKDRRAISERVFGVQRRRARLDWWRERAGGNPTPSPCRARVLADLALNDRLGLAEIAALFDGAGHAPVPLDAGERSLLAALAGRALAHDDMPNWVALEYPAWLDGPLKRALGVELAAEMAALNGPAPLDLRVNALKTDRESARAALAREGVDAEPTPYSPSGLRVSTRADLNATRAFRDGLVEVQDEGSQLVAWMTDVRPGMRIVDFCAGAGGKTLALAALLQGSGSLIACDVAERRLARMDGRLRRAGAGFVEQRRLDVEAESWIEAVQGTADRVLLDVPCTATGTWRRAPEARWHLASAQLNEHVARQQTILGQAAGLVKPGGRLIYATCSLLEEENEAQMERFLNKAGEFTAIPADRVWEDVLAAPCPMPGPYLRLSPHRSGTDGFFAAILERRDDTGH